VKARRDGWPKPRDRRDVWTDPLHKLVPSLVPPPTDEHTLPAGVHYGGCTLRVQAVRCEAGRKPVPAVSMRYPGGSGMWFPAPLRDLAQRFTRGTPVWAWLRSKGVRRPSPSGSRVPTSSGTPRSKMPPSLELRLSPEALIILDKLAKSNCLSRAEVVNRALAIAYGMPVPSLNL